MKGIVGLTVIIVFSFMIGGPLGFIVLGSLLGLGIKKVMRS